MPLEAIAEEESFAIVASRGWPTNRRMEILMTVDLSDGNKNMDYAQHQRTYGLFIGLVKYGTVAVVIILILMGIFLV
jgi:hypothetical protein